MQTKSQNNPAQQQMLGHPKGLFYLFFAELWERFSFYGMKALLVLYMTSHLLYSDKMSFGIFAAYMSLVYITPIVGGLIADRVIGYRRAIMLGGVLMALGHFLLSFELPVFFYGSLALIIVGNGLFKPNISSFVGALYEEDDARRDSGFTIFYMGINVGGALAPLLCAWLADAYGWHYGFMLAGFGMLAGLWFFRSGLKSEVFGNEGHIPDEVYFRKKVVGLDKGQLTALIAILAVPVFALLVKFYEYEHYLVGLASLALVGYLIYVLSSVSKEERGRLGVSIYFTMLAILFWAIFEQAGSSLTLFADRNVNLIGMNAAQTNSINSGFIMLLALPFSLLWSWLSKRGINPNSPIKFGLGLFFLGLGFIVFALAGHEADGLAQTPMFYLVAGYFVLTVGEMFLSPIGLSKMTELSPTKYIAFIMGVWFAGSFYGHFFAGKIAQMTAVGEESNSAGWWNDLVNTLVGFSSAEAQTQGEAFQQLYAYISTYANFGLITLLVGLGAIAISPIVKRWMFGVK